MKKRKTKKKPPKRNTALADASLLAQCDYCRTLDIQNCKIRNPYCFMPLSVICYSNNRTLIHMYQRKKERKKK